MSDPCQPQTPYSWLSSVMSACDNLYTAYNQVKKALEEANPIAQFEETAHLRKANAALSECIKILKPAVNSLANIDQFQPH